MIRTALVAALTLATATGAFAQSASSPSQTLDMQAYLKARGESYSRAPDAQQNPAEVAETARLNAGIVAGNEAADRTDAENGAAQQAAEARWREETARTETQRAQWDADKAAADAASAEHQRAMATWESLIRACEASGRRDCRVNDPR